MATSRRRTPRQRPTTVILVRHAQTPTTGKVLPGRAPGLKLSDAGRDQARRAAELLTGVAVDAIYTSPLERARQTAAPIGDALGLCPVVDKGLNECDFGEWTGRSLAELMRTPEWKTIQQAPSTFTFPGGESFAAMQHRIVAAVDRLRAAHAGGTIVCVSHADVIKAAVAHAVGTHLDLFQRIVISPASISVVAFTDGGPMALAVNTMGGKLDELLGRERGATK